MSEVPRAFEAFGPWGPEAATFLANVDASTLTPWPPIDWMQVRPLSESSHAATTRVQSGLLRDVQALGTASTSGLDSGTSRSVISTVVSDVAALTPVVAPVPASEVSVLPPFDKQRASSTVGFARKLRDLRFPVLLQLRISASFRKFHCPSLICFPTCILTVTELTEAEIHASRIAVGDPVNVSADSNQSKLPFPFVVAFSV